MENIGGRTNSNIENIKKQVLNNLGVLRAHVDLLSAFSFNVFEHSKCTTMEVKLNTKARLAHKLQPKIISHVQTLEHVEAIHKMLV